MSDQEFSSSLLATEIEHAQALLRQSRYQEAELAYLRVLERDPGHLEGLNVTAMAALRRGETASAIAALRRAVTIDPNDVASQTNLGFALAHAGDDEAAIAQLREALRLRPQSFVTRLHLAGILDRQGKDHDALIAYFRAVNDAQRQGRWRTESATPPGLLPAVVRGMRVINEGRRAYYGRVLEPLRKRYGPEALVRVEQCLAGYLGDLSLKPPNPQQRPGFLYFPGLNAGPYIDHSRLSWVSGLEAETSAIREELLALLHSESGRERVFHDATVEGANLRGEAPSWNGYYFFRHGDAKLENHARCPQTSAALACLPLARVPEHAPEALFSVFTAGTHLLPHCGVTNTRVVAHLPLIVPNDCALRVAGRVHHWREGKVVVFDDTYEHEAWNRSEQMRVVLIVDLWHPELSEVERHAVRDLVVAIGEFRKECDAP